jgi:hypothetical protein
MLHQNHQHHGQQRTPTTVNNNNNNAQLFNQPYSVVDIESQHRQQPLSAKNLIYHSQQQVKPTKPDEEVVECDSDESTDNEEGSHGHHVYVTFDVPTQAARLLKKLACENFYRLNEIGVKSVKLRDEPAVKVSKKQEVNL